MTTSSIIGTTISHYSILSKIGAGGMGEVCLAQDTKLDRNVAIKFLPESLVADEQARKRLVREACIYALEGRSDEAVKWLREAAVTGFPCYPLFERDAYLNRIRQVPEFIQFMAEMRAQNERYRREFGEGATR
jgi:serine/threonine protein kinase